MDLLTNALKGQVNSMNLIIFTVILSFLLYRMKRRKAGLIFGFAALMLFVIFSTGYVPGYLVKKLESRYTPFNDPHKFSGGEKVYIQVLGGGYTTDERLPPQAQLSYATLGRLSEAIRIFNKLANSVLVVSGNVASGDQSMAVVVKKAAISLGVDGSRIEMLEDPSTTMEEARAFASRYGTSSKVIIVTDALHMPRAMKFFEESGVIAHPAPTNYHIKVDDNPFALRWMPSAENFLLMDRAMREFMGWIKGAL